MTMCLVTIPQFVISGSKIHRRPGNSQVIRRIQTPLQVPQPPRTAGNGPGAADTTAYRSEQLGLQGRTRPRHTGKVLPGAPQGQGQRSQTHISTLPIPRSDLDRRNRPCRANVLCGWCARGLVDAGDENSHPGRTMADRPRIWRTSDNILKGCKTRTWSHD